MKRKCVHLVLCAPDVLDPLSACESRLCWDQQRISERSAAIGDFLLAKSGGRIVPGLTLTFLGVRSSRDTILLPAGAKSDEKPCKAAPGFTALAKVEADFFHFLA